MMYKYTWNHLLLFAQMCNCEDTNATVTENWVKSLESQQERLFPFTLWPLTYRTSAVIASTSLVSPSVSTVSSRKKDQYKCSINFKIYKSNEVVIMCFQHVGDHTGTCPELCKFDTGSVSEGHGIHCRNKRQPLVPCGLMSMFSRVKKKAMIELVKFRSENFSKFSCIICVGYDIGAILASFMACDLANEFKCEAEFMGLDKPEITVDCIGFSTPTVVANDVYWKELESLVDRHLNVKHVEEALQKEGKAVVFVGNKPRGRRKYNITKRLSDKKVKNVPFSRYIDDINQSLII